MSNSKKENRNQQIQSFVRVRPLNAQEREQRSHSVIDIPSNREVNVRQHAMSKKFTFDRVFGPKSTQMELYSSVVSPLIQEVLDGYNCTVFAYGQTGTGKTYTMAGGSENKSNVSWQNDPDAGIIPRTLSQLFDELRLLQVEHTVRVSYLELYNEELFDLLSPTDDSSKIRLYEDNVKKGSVIVHGLEEVIVHNKNEVYKILQKGSEKRQTASTLMNAQSSRSHTVFSITVHTKENTLEGEDLLKTGKLNLVDLAGSENIGRSGAVDKRAREAGNINQSLLTLGRVITALVERAPHVPYRESKLTRLLQDSLGGRTKTSIIATVSPAMCNLDETLSTLEYAHRAKNITNRPEINQKFTKSALLKEYTEEIERLRRDLTAARSCNGIFLAPENYRHMIDEIENYTRELTEKINEHRAVTEELEKVRDICTQLNLKLTEAQAALMETEEKLKEVTAISEEEAHLNEKYSATEAKLGQQARTLLHVVENVTKDTGKLHDKLEKVKRIENKNTKESENFQNIFNSNLCQMQHNVETLIQTQNNFIEKYITRNIETINLNKSEILGIKQNLIDLFNIANELNSKMSTTTVQTIENDTKNNENLKNSIQVKFETFFETFSELLNQQILPLLQNYVDNSNKKIEQIHVNQQRLFETFMITQHNFETHCINSQSRLESSLKQYSDLHDRNNSAVNEINEAMKHNDEKREELMAILEVISQNEKLIKDRTKQIDLTSKKMFTNYEEYVQNEKEIGKESIIESKQHLSEHKNNVVKQSNDLIDKENVFQRNCINLQENIIKNVTECKENIDNNIQIIQTEITDNLKQNLDKNNLMSNLTTNMINNLSELNLKSNNLETMVLKYQNDSKILCDENMQVLKHENNELHEYIISEVHNRSIEVQKFLTEDIILQGSKPTGNTPVRKDFIPYPRYLASTSPREVILERFRKRKLLDGVEFTNGNSSCVPKTEVVDETNDELVQTVALVKSASTNDLLHSVNGENCNSLLVTPKNNSLQRLSGKENTKSVPTTQKSNSTSQLIMSKRQVLGSSNN